MFLSEREAGPRRHPLEGVLLRIIDERSSYPLEAVGGEEHILSGLRPRENKIYSNKDSYNQCYGTLKL